MEEITALNSLNKILEGKCVLVDFYAEWCQPCKMLSPIIEKLSTEYAGKITFVKVNIDEAKELAQRYNVMSIPTIILFKYGMAESSFAGFIPEEKVREFIDSHVDPDDISMTENTSDDIKEDVSGIQIKREFCIGCGSCVNVCPARAMSLDSEGKAWCENELCIDCLTCVGMCPTGAIVHKR